MQAFIHAVVTALWGLWLIVSGAMRYAEAQSVAALGFGSTTGVLALIAAALFWKKRPGWAKLLTALILLFVVGFFATKASKEGLDLRVGITLAASLIEAIIVFKPAKKE